MGVVEAVERVAAAVCLVVAVLVLTGDFQVTVVQRPGLVYRGLMAGRAALDGIAGSAPDLRPAAGGER